MSEFKQTVAFVELDV